MPEMPAPTISTSTCSARSATAVADVCLRVPTDETPRVQEVCLHLGHTICELVEVELHPAP